MKKQNPALSSLDSIISAIQAYTKLTKDAVKNNDKERLDLIINSFNNTSDHITKHLDLLVKKLPSDNK